jgi:hypothetical protein
MKALFHVGKPRIKQKVAAAKVKRMMQAGTTWRDLA